MNTKPDLPAPRRSLQLNGTEGPSYKNHRSTKPKDQRSCFVNASTLLLLLRGSFLTKRTLSIHDSMRIYDYENVKAKSRRPGRQHVNTITH